MATQVIEEEEEQVEVINTKMLPNNTTTLLNQLLTTKKLVQTHNLLQGRQQQRGKLVEYKDYLSRVSNQRPNPHIPKEKHKAMEKAKGNLQRGIRMDRPGGLTTLSHYTPTSDLSKQANGQNLL